jgi:hypothetical protein
MSKEKIEVIQYIEKCPRCGYPTSALQYLQSAHSSWFRKGSQQMLERCVKIIRERTLHYRKAVAKQVKIDLIEALETLRKR